MLSGPLDEALRPMFAHVTHIGKLVHSILSEDPQTEKGSIKELEIAIEELEAQRCAAIQPNFCTCMLCHMSSQVTMHRFAADRLGNITEIQAGCIMTDSVALKQDAHICGIPCLQ